MIARIVYFVTISMILAASFVSCANPADGGESSAVDLKIVNSTGFDIVMKAGDWSAYLAAPSTYVVPYQLTLSSTKTTSFGVPKGKSVNLWYSYNDGTKNWAVFLAQDSAARNFVFETGLHYTITLNPSNSYTYSDGTTPPTTVVSGTITSRVFPAMSRTDAVEGDSPSQIGANLKVIRGSVVGKKYSGATKYTFLAEIQYDVATGTKELSFPKARIEFLDSSGSVLAKSYTSADTSNGYKYFYADVVSRYFFDGEYTYGFYDLFPGNHAFLTDTVTVNDSDTASPYNGLDVSKIATMRLTLTGSDYSSLKHQTVPTADAPVKGSPVIGEALKQVISNPSTTFWWDLGGSTQMLFTDSDSRLLDYTYAGFEAGSDQLIGPGESSTLQGTIPSDIQGQVTGSILLLDYDAGTAPAAGRAGAKPSFLLGAFDRTASRDAQAQADAARAAEQMAVR